jgi:hypothetical protein
MASDVRFGSKADKAQERDQSATNRHRARQGRGIIGHPAFVGDEIKMQSPATWFANGVADPFASALTVAAAGSAYANKESRFGSRLRDRTQMHK